MNRITKTAFFGSNYKIAQSVHRAVPVSGIYTEEKNFNTDLFNFAKQQNIPFFIIHTLSDLDALCSSNPELAVMYGTGLIMKQKQIDSFQPGIWNTHPGKLPSYRGRHPISWALINNEPDIGLCIHQINTQIDQGVLLASIDLPRDMNDTQNDMDRKINTAFEQGFFEQALENYYQGNCETLSEGEYHESLVSKFASIDPSEHTGPFVFNLFKSQFSFGGVVVECTRYTSCDFYYEAKKDHYPNGKVFECGNGDKIILH